MFRTLNSTAQHGVAQHNTHNRYLRKSPEYRELSVSGDIEITKSNFFGAVVTAFLVRLCGDPSRPPAAKEHGVA